jgi:hypothetical protein
VHCERISLALSLGEKFRFSLCVFAFAESVCFVQLIEPFELRDQVTRCVAYCFMWCGIIISCWKLSNLELETDDF